MIDQPPRNRMLFVGLLTLPAFIWLAISIVTSNLAYACHWRQWPPMARCEDPSALPVKDYLQKQRDHLSANPGDSLAYADLARFAGQPQALLQTSSSAVLDAAGIAAPYDATVLQIQAGQALQKGEWPKAVSQLVLLSEKFGSSDARAALAALLARSRAEPELMKALLIAAKQDQTWLLSVVRMMPSAELPASMAAPLAGQLAQSVGLQPKLGQMLIRQLKTERAWVDAYAIWLSLWKKPLGFLFNGDFEQPFLPDTFDWEVLDKKPYQAGAQVSLSGNGKQGQSLLVKFTGRLIRTPIVRQHLMLPPGNYQLSGQYQSSNLRSNEGLAWTLVCGEAKQELARSPALIRTGQQWTPFGVDFRVGNDCGPVVHLLLQTQAPYEARTGQHGEIRFDNFDLKRRAAP